MRRNFAPPDERLRSLVARELQIPKVLEAARQNLQQSTQGVHEVALQQLPDTIKFFQKDVPEAFREVKDPELLAGFKSQQRRGGRGLEKISGLSAGGPAAGIQRRFSPGRRELPQEAAVRRDGGHSAGSPAGDRLCRLAAQPGSTSRKSPPRSIPSALRQRCWPICERTTPRRPVAANLSRHPGRLAPVH